MKLHFNILKATAKSYASHDDVYWSIKEYGGTANAQTVAVELRRLVRRGLIKYKEFANKNNAGTHRRYLKVRVKK